MAPELPIEYAEDHKPQLKLIIKTEPVGHCGTSSSSVERERETG